MLDKSKSFSNYIQFNNYDYIIGENPIVDGVDMLMDEIKIFDKVLSAEEIWINYGGAQSPYAFKQYTLACISCLMVEAIDSCPRNTHLCSEQEVLSGAWQVARQNGWLRETQRLWFTSQLSQSYTEKEKLSKDLRVGVCCQNGS